jgi:hypothetical protein
MTTAPSIHRDYGTNMGGASLYLVYKCTPIIIVDKLHLYIIHVYLTLHL